MPYTPKSKKTKITDPEKKRLFGSLMSNDNVDDINGLANLANANESKINNIDLQVSETQEQLAFLGQEVQAKQDELISGINIKTVNGNSLLGSGDIPIAGGGGVSDGDKGDITVSSSGSVWTIDNLAVTDAKIHDVSPSKVNQDSSHRFATDAEKTTWNGKADLVGGKVPSSQIPSIAITEFLGTVSSQSAMLALAGEQGDWCIRSDEQSGYVLIGNTPSSLGDWQKIVTPASPVSTVNGQVGNVVLGKSDVGLSNVDNTSDLNKPISTATQTALNAKEDTITAGTTSQYFRGDKTFQALDKTAVGLSNVDNTSDASKPVSTAQATAIGLKQDSLVSGTNIKTVNSTSLLGAGNISVGSVTSVATAAPLTGGTITSSGTIGISQSTTSTDGYLSSTDWNTFNNKQAALSNGYGITGIPTPAVSLSNAQAFCTATTSISLATYADITGASISLAAGTWLILATINGYAANTAIQLNAAITDSANTILAEGTQGVPASGTASVNQWVNIGLSVIVTPSVTTTYKLRGARGNTTITGTITIADGSGQGVTNNATSNTDKGTSIRAIRIA